MNKNLVIVLMLLLFAVVFFISMLSDNPASRQVTAMTGHIFDIVTPVTDSLTPTKCQAEYQICLAELQEYETPEFRDSIRAQCKLKLKNCESYEKMFNNSP